MTLWTFPQSAPIIAPGTLHPRFDCARASAPHVVRFQDHLRMVYWGSDHVGQYTVLQADAPLDKPNAWHAHGTPLITAQPHNALNSQGPSFPFLLPVTDTRWFLYFTGWGKWTTTKLPNTTGLAVSEDAGRTWRYHPHHPIIPLDRPYDQEGTGSIWILHEPDRFRMYYTAIGHYAPKPDGVATGHGDIIPTIGIAYAESTDGIHWEKPFADYIVSPRGFGVEPYEYICSKPCVIKTATGYIMWVNTFGTAYRVHRLTSEDGIHWQWAARLGSDGEFGVGTPGSFDDHQRSYPTILDLHGTRHAWYAGNRFGSAGMGYAIETR